MVWIFIKGNNTRGLIIKGIGIFFPLSCIKKEENELCVGDRKRNVGETISFNTCSCADSALFI